MNILYVSCHAVLEFDEVLLLRSLGHSVTTFSDLLPIHKELNSLYRPSLLPIQLANGALPKMGFDQDIVVTKQLLLNFDLVVVMHSPEWLFNKIAQELEIVVIGPGNESLKQFGGSLSYEELKEALRKHRCMLYLGTAPACYTLSFIEAWMTGLPIICVSKQLAPHYRLYPHQDLFEAPELIADNNAGLIGDSIEHLVESVKVLTHDIALAMEFSSMGQMAARKHFSKDIAAEQWTTFLNNQVCKN
jgi:glycosyltransferase involved in cell wall biosynthesis